MVADTTDDIAAQLRRRRGGKRDPWEKYPRDGAA
jgi:hypothetical protein